jgi:3-hydroxyisobutyryl-CoA hydrolase
MIIIFQFFKGYRLKGRNVLDAGIATHYVESKNLEELENDLIRCKTSTEIDQLLSKYTPKQNHEFVLQPHLKNIEKAFSADKIEEILHNLHSIGNEWAMDTLKLLSKMSPASLKITLRQLQLGKTMTLKECLQMEFRLATHCCIDSDFKEGVRALLIDKDQKPRWKHSKVEEVTQEYVERFFSPLPDFDELEFDSKSKL